MESFQAKFLPDLGRVIYNPASPHSVTLLLEELGGNRISDEMFAEAKGRYRGKEHEQHQYVKRRLVLKEIKPEKGNCACNLLFVGML